MVITKILKPEELNSTTLAEIVRRKAPLLSQQIAVDLMQYVLDTLAEEKILG